MYAYSVDGYMIPGEVVNRGDESGIEKYLDKIVIFQYIPAIAKNRAYSTPDGHGYNFITQTTI